LPRANRRHTADVPALTPEQDCAVLQEAGFTDVTEFFSASRFADGSATPDVVLELLG